MLKVARRLLLVLIAFAVVGGQTTQLAQSAEYAAPMTMAGMPCDMMMPAIGTDHGKPMTPCKGMTPDCIKLMGCITDVALPARFVSNAFTVRFTAVDYWSASSELAEIVSTPEPLPPRTIEPH
jgi:hypothetical protein